MRMLTQGSIGGIAALSALLLAPQAGVAQEEGEMYEEAECTFEVTPEYVQSGQAAVSVAVVLSSAVGEIEDIDAKDSGLSLADPADLSPTEMANPEENPEAETDTETEEPKPVEMALTENEATLWLNTEDSDAGTHEFALEGTDGTCKGTITVEGGEEMSDQDGR